MKYLITDERGALLGDHDDYASARAEYDRRVGARVAARLIAISEWDDGADAIPLASWSPPDAERRGRA